MNPMEKKLNAVMRCLAAGNPADRESAREEISRMLTDANIAAPPVAENYEAAVRRVLLDIGVPENILGHRYLVTALCAVLRKPDLVGAITKELYPYVASNCGTTASRAERAIRHAVEVAWDRGDYDTLTSYFGNTISSTRGRPTNSEFIARIANVIRHGTK